MHLAAVNAASLKLFDSAKYKGIYSESIICASPVTVPEPLLILYSLLKVYMLFIIQRPNQYRPEDTRSLNSDSRGVTFSRVISNARQVIDKWHYNLRVLRKAMLLMEARRSTAGSTLTAFVLLQQDHHICKLCRAPAVPVWSNALCVLECQSALIFWLIKIEPKSLGV